MAVSRDPGKRRGSMTDVLMLDFSIAFFAIALLYVKAREKLRQYSSLSP
jgi:uncharacterized membrane protein